MPVDLREHCSHSDYMVKTATVGARELKTRLGTYLRKVRGGTTIVITDRGEPIAELRPLDRASDPTEAALARLEARGLITRGQKKPRKPFRPIKLRGPSASQALQEDREDRF